MDLKDSIKQLSERIEKLKENIQTEEATKITGIVAIYNWKKRNTIDSHASTR